MSAVSVRRTPRGLSNWMYTDTRSRVRRGRGDHDDKDDEHHEEHEVQRDDEDERQQEEHEDGQNPGHTDVRYLSRSGVEYSKLGADKDDENLFVTYSRRSKCVSGVEQ